MKHAAGLLSRRIAALFVLLALAFPAFASSLVLVSEPGDPIGEGRTRQYSDVSASYRPVTNDGITVENRSFLVGVTARGANGESAFVTFYAPIGQTLLPGRYENALPYNQGDELPGLGINLGNGAACLQLGIGRFEVHEAKYAVHGYIERFRASFEFQCGGRGTPAILGEVDIANPPPAAPPTKVKLRFENQGVLLKNGAIRLAGTIACSRTTSATVSWVVRQRLPDGRLTGGERLDYYVPSCCPKGRRFKADLVPSNGPFRKGEATVLAKALVADPVYPYLVEYYDDTIKLKKPQKK